MKKILTQIVSRSVLIALVSASSLCVSTQSGFCVLPPFVIWDPAAGGNGHFYRAVPRSAGLTWDAANTLAQQQGGYLATITSAAENNFVFGLINSSQFFTSFNGSGPAIGGFQIAGSQEPGAGWSWVTGEGWSYTNWAQGQPDNGFGPNENRLEYFSGLGGTPAATWNDLGQSDSNIGGYVVEVVPEPGSISLFGMAALLALRRFGKNSKQP